MKKLIKTIYPEKGFTLLEIIVTVTIAAIMASILMSFMGASIVKSADPINETRNLGASIQTIETRTAAYEEYLNGKRTWTSFKSIAGCVDNECNADCCELTSEDGDLYNSKFETLRITVTSNNQKLNVYFTQH